MAPVPANGRSRLLYILAGVFAFLVGSYLIRRIFLPNVEVEDTNSKVQLDPVMPIAVPPPSSPAQEQRPPEAVQPDHGGSQQNSGQQDNSSGQQKEEPGPLVEPDGSQHNIVHSTSTSDGKWFPLDFSPLRGYNPNILPHPELENTWYMIAQMKQQGGGEGATAGPRMLYSTELWCEAVFTSGTLKCKMPPMSLPIGSTTSDKCEGWMSFYDYIIGPTDPRAFYGPDRPYITYGSPSAFTCLGQYIHDLRRLLQFADVGALDKTQRFFFPTELQRPPPYRAIEKNWFAFWDREGEMYLHYDLSPARSFAKVSKDGHSIGPDLAPAAAAHDARCLASAMPALREEEHVHQATNSLSITLCRRDDTTCDREKQTFIFTIFHHKRFHGHNLYEPYVMLFENQSPFEMHAVSARPFWVSGRGSPKEKWSSEEGREGTSQMMYITSVNWKMPGLNYTGYLDDELMVAFGVEDESAGGIDVKAEELFRELKRCD